MKRRRLRIFGGIVSLIALVALLLPILARSGVSIPLCDVQSVSAQDDPCLDREVTISAQQVQILQLQGTINAQEVEILLLQGTLIPYTNQPVNRIVITVPVIITATQTGHPITPTPNPFQLTASALQSNCFLHTIVEGDTPFGIAQQYGIDYYDLLAVNGLDESSAALLQIGDVLIVPLPGCSLLATSQPTRTPPNTLPPTATNAQVEIVRVLSPGDINAEGVDIRNNGAVVDLTGWTLSDGQGNIYVFPEQRIFTGSVHTVYTRAGTDTPQAKFWGLKYALWHTGSVVTLADSDGNIQSNYWVG